MKQTILNMSKRTKNLAFGGAYAVLVLAAVFPLLCCGVHTALHCTEARGGLPAGSERRHRQ